MAAVRWPQWLTTVNSRVHWGLNHHTCLKKQKQKKMHKTYSRSTDFFLVKMYEYCSIRRPTTYSTHSSNYVLLSSRARRHLSAMSGMLINDSSRHAKVASHSYIKSNSPNRRSQHISLLKNHITYVFKRWMPCSEWVDHLQHLSGEHHSRRSSVTSHDGCCIHCIMCMLIGGDIGSV